MNGCGPTYNDIIESKVESISFNNILNLAIIDLASIGVTGILDLLTIDEKIDGMDVVMTIMKNCIDENERVNPQGLTIYPYYQTGVPYTFVDNFWEFLAGKVNRDNLQLIPRVIVSIVGTYLGTLRSVEYNPPTLHQIMYSGTFRTRIIANRPYKMEKAGDKFSEDSRYYFMGENYNKEVLERFRLLFKLRLGEYILRLNRNLEHPNLPLTTFDGLSEGVSDWNSRYRELLESSFSYYDIYDNQ